MSSKVDPAVLQSDRPPSPPPEPHPLNPYGLLLVTRPPPTYRGVFTGPSQTLAAGTVIERAPVLVLGRDEWLDHGRRTQLDHYAFVWGRSGAMAVAFGLGSMFNHSPTPNVSYIRDLPSETIRFVTSTRIGPNTELTISYGPESALWFSPDYAADHAASSGAVGGAGAAQADDGESAEEALLRIARELAEDAQEDEEAAGVVEEGGERPTD